MKRFLGILLTAVMLCTACAAFADDTLAMSDIPGMTAAGVLPIVTEPVTITIGLVAEPNVVDYDTNWFTQWLEETTGINIEFYYRPSTGAADKLEMMFAANEKIPDIVINSFDDESKVTYYGTQGYILPLNEYFEKYGYFWQNTMDTYATEQEKYMMNQLMYAYDGNVYAFPALSSEKGNEGENGMYINKVWLDKLGLEVPTTTEEFYKVLVAFRDMDPNGNGKADEIPFVGYNSFDRRGDIVGDVLNAFTYYPYGFVPHVRYVVEDGVVSSAATKEEYREGLRYCKKLYDEGLLNPLSFTQTYAELKAMFALPSTEDTIVGCFATHFASGGAGFGGSNADYNKNMEYVAMPALIGPEGVQYAPRTNASYMFRTFISADCEHPEVAFRLLDYLCDPAAYLTMRYGPEGDGWTWAEEGALDMVGNQALYLNLHEQQGIQDYWSMDSQNMIWRTSGFVCVMTANMQPVNIENPDPYVAYTTKTFWEAVALRDDKEPAETFKTRRYNEDQQAIVDEYEVDLYNYTNECRTLFITGGMDLDKDWDSYLTKLDEMGLNTLLAAVQEAYDTMNAANK